MPDLILMQGPPGSGKTTWALDRREEYRKDDELCLIIGRDIVRDLLGVGWGSPILEPIVTTFQEEMVLVSMGRGINVIIDNTHLGPNDPVTVRRWMLLGRDYDYRARTQVMRTSLAECLRRNAERPDPEPGKPIQGCRVPDDVIKRMYLRLNGSGSQH